MSEKMLMFTNIVKQNPPKREALTRRGDLMKFIMNTFTKKQRSNQADVLSAESLFAKFIVP